MFKLQKQFQRVFGFTLPLFHGRGIFNYNYGLMVGDVPRDCTSPAHTSAIPPPHRLRHRPAR